MPMRGLATLIAATLLISASLARADSSLAPPTFQPTVSEALRLAQRQLQVAAVKLRKAKDFGLAEASGQLADARRNAEMAMTNIDQALERLDQSPDGAVTRHAVRQVRLKQRAAREALAIARADLPDGAIAALRDLDHATQQVEHAAQLAGRPSGGAARER